MAGRRSAQSRSAGARHARSAARLGKSKTVLVIAQGDKIKEAEEAGADFVGGEDMVNKIKGGWLDFDAVIATPDMMRLVGGLGKVLGPRGLMPNPKTGTVTFDVKTAIKETKAGKVEYRVDKTGVIHSESARFRLSRQDSRQCQGAARSSREGEAVDRKRQVREEGQSGCDDEPGRFAR